MTEEWTQGDFWAASAQVLPVLGLGVALEIRQGARLWEKAPLWYRGIQSVFGLVLGLGLTVAFFATTSALAARVDRPEAIVEFCVYAMQVSFLVLVVNVVIQVLMRGLADVPMWMSRRAPWGVVARVRRRLRPLSRELDEIDRSVSRLIDQSREDRLRIELVLGRRGRLDSEETVFVRDMLEKEVVGKTAADRDALMRAFKNYEGRQTTARAVSIRAMARRYALRRLASARLARVIARNVREQINNLIAATDPHQLSPLEIERLHDSLAAAAEASAF